MGRVLTNAINASYTIESELGTAGTEWKVLEPNTISTFGAEITTVARDPISKNRQRRKGTVTDLDSSMEFEHDLGISVFEDFVEGFAFARAVNHEMSIPFTAVSADGEYTVPALTQTQADKIKAVNDQYATLFQPKNAANPNNNRLFHCEDAGVAGATAIDGRAISNETNFQAETGANGVLELAGVRFTAGSGNPALSYDTTTRRLTVTAASGATNFRWQDLGVTVGQVVGIMQWRTDNVIGYGRVVSRDGLVLVLDKVSPALRTQAQITENMDVLFGRYVRNVPVDDDDYIERSFQFEVEFPNLGDNNATEYQYSIGNFCNSMAFNLPLTDKSTMTMNFIGTDTENPTATRKAGAAGAAELVDTVAFNTSEDIARLRVTEVDEDGISTDFKSLTFTINNNVSAEKVLGKLGARFMNTGNFEIDIEATMLFSNGRVVNKIRDNETVSMDFILHNDNGGIAIDAPSMTLGGGSREFPVNETVTISVTAQAFQDATLGTSIGISLFPFLPQRSS